MKKRLFYMVLLLLTLPYLLKSQVTVHTIGDSTMEQKSEDPASNPNGQRGWPQMLGQFMMNGATINNRAKSGTSSKTFYTEKDSNGNLRFWATVKPQIKSGDYVFIQFGHNDEKDGGWQSGTDYTGIGTNPWEQYTRYLTYYVNEVRALGAIPILFTPIVRNGFSGTTMTNTACHNIGIDSIGRALDYPAAMRKVAQDLNCQLIDHTLLTKAYCEQIGQSQTSSLVYNVGDGTHLGIFGATAYARLAVKELIKQGILTQYLNANPDLSLSTSILNYGKSFVNASTILQVSMSGTDLSPADGTITVTAPTGYSLSTSQTGTFTSTLNYPYTLGTLNLTTFFVKYKPAEVGLYNDSIIVTNGTKTKKIAVKGECVVLTGQNANVLWDLTTTSDAVVTGPVDAISESYSNMKLQSYAAPNTTTIWTGGLIANGTKTQRNVIDNATGAWPAGEIDIVNDRYIQFGVRAIQGTTFNIDSIGLYAGGAGGSGMRFKVYISKDSLFTNPDVTTMIHDRGTVANASNTMYPLGYNKLIELQSGRSLYLRIYPWYNGTATGKSICLYGLLIKGVVTAVPTEIQKPETFNSEIKCIPSVTTGNAVLKYSLGSSSDVVINIKTIDGRTVKSAGFSKLPDGEHQLPIDISGFSSGVYLCTLQTHSGTVFTRIVKK